jgi:hypothetical protein
MSGSLSYPEDNCTQVTDNLHKENKAGDLFLRNKGGTNEGMRVASCAFNGGEGMLRTMKELGIGRLASTPQGVDAAVSGDTSRRNSRW